MNLNGLTWVNVVRCLRLAGVGQDAVVGVCTECWLRDDTTPLPGDVIPPDDNPLFGSGFSFLKAPSAGRIAFYIISKKCFY